MGGPPPPPPQHTHTHPPPQEFGLQGFQQALCCRNSDWFINLISPIWVLFYDLTIENVADYLLSSTVYWRLQWQCSYSQRLGIERTFLHLGSWWVQFSLLRTVHYDSLELGIQIYHSFIMNQSGRESWGRGSYRGRNKDLLMPNDLAENLINRWDISTLSVVSTFLWLKRIWEKPV